MTDIDGDEITADNGTSLLLVDTSPLPGDLFPPFVDVGDRILVFGEMDAADLFDE